MKVPSPFSSCNSGSRQVKGSWGFWSFDVIIMYWDFFYTDAGPSVAIKPDYVAKASL